jgi:hypothetical protein
MRARESNPTLVDLVHHSVKRLLLLEVKSPRRQGGAL